LGSYSGCARIIAGIFGMNLSILPDLEPLKDYFEKLKAPLKGFYTFEQSAHSLIFEEPEKAQRILQEDVLVRANSLADAK
jgi:hypothetical protein